MKSSFCASVLLLLFIALPFPANAASLVAALLPASDLVKEDPRAVRLLLQLFAPLERTPQAVARPKRLAVQHLGETGDLLASLGAGAGTTAGATVATGWVADVPLRRPGDYTFFSETTPAWDPAEEQFVVHAVKVCVHAAGPEEGWDEPAGLEAEIVPLSRPYGLWAGNLFSGQVLLKGEPAPYAEVRIVTLGETPERPAPAPLPDAVYAVQTVRADAGGVFHYAMPRAGWWGFTAVIDVDWTLKREGADQPVAIHAGYWVNAREIK